MAFQDPNAAALAAGAKPGQSVTIGGNTFIVKAPTPVPTEYNLKHPKINFDGEYPYLHVTQDGGGGQIINNITPGKESFFHIQPSGSYHGHSADGSKVEATANGTWAYSGNGHVTTVDGNHDVKVSGGSRQNHDSGVSKEVNGDHYQGGSGHQIDGTSDTKYHHSSGDIFNTVEGDYVSDRVGSVHDNVTGDHVIHITGNKTEIVSSGDSGINIQNGNMDIQIDSGKARLYSLNDMLIQSVTSITLKVGSSIIVMSPNGITIHGTTVKINE